LAVVLACGMVPLATSSDHGGSLGHIEWVLGGIPELRRLVPDLAKL
jgi:hypothetical protein